MTFTAQRAVKFETAEQHKLYVALANNAHEVREAQRLRYRVFVEEMGAKIECEQPGIESDRFDPFCRHLLVRNTETQEVVGCYRILTNTGAIKAGGYYSQQEFDLGRILSLPGRFMEVGRTCVHPGYRNGAVISLLWAGLARFMVLNKFDYLIGCASIPLGPGMDQVAGIWNALSAKHLTSPDQRVYPKKTLPGLDLSDAPAAAEIPPLVKGYMRLGAEIGGAPYWDEQFNVADLFILLSIRRLNRRYARHFLHRA
ncbi:MAG: GNAT family N-acetyltransferase [Gammaproteobacteria bacterium]